MVEIPETQQAEALQRVAALGAQRAAALAEADRLTTELQAAAVQAGKAGASRSRISSLAQVGRPTVYAWLRAAGFELGESRNPSGRGKAQQDKAA